jgi:hypothetical protein
MDSIRYTGLAQCLPHVLIQVVTMLCDCSVLFTAAMYRQFKMLNVLVKNPARLKLSSADNGIVSHVGMLSS